MNYPTGIKKEFLDSKKEREYKNLGMNLESDINSSNEYYINKDKAYIYKKPTPIKLVKVDYQKGEIKEAYFEKPSTTDYNGIYRGRYIDFEAKETKLNYFPLSNIHNHQIEHLRKIINMGGIGFIIVRFTTLNQTYYLNGKELFLFLESENRKSIPLEFFKEKGYLLKDKLRPLIDYLEAVERDWGCYE